MMDPITTSALTTIGEFALAKLISRIAFLIPKKDLFKDVDSKIIDDIARDIRDEYCKEKVIEEIYRSESDLKKEFIYISDKDKQEFIYGFFENNPTMKTSNVEKVLNDYISLLNSKINSVMSDEGKLIIAEIKKGTKDIIDTSDSNTDKIIKEVKELKNNISYKCIEDINEWLKENTDIQISLDFFDYDQEEFTEEFLQNLRNSNNNNIYVRGKTREETLYCILKIIKDNKYSDCYIINDIDSWQKASDIFLNKILIPDFNANEITTVKGNKCIFVFGEEDITNKSVIELKKRLAKNMYEKLIELGVDTTDAYNLVQETNCLFSVLKRKKFKGKTGSPKWENGNQQLFIPALLCNCWSKSDGDKEIIAGLAGMQYDKFETQISNHMHGEDPFVIKSHSHFNECLKLANTEEAWAVLYNVITKDTLVRFKELLKKVILSGNPIFEVPPEQHFSMSLNVEKPKYSNELKKGMLVSLIMLTNQEYSDLLGELQPIQSWVDGIVLDIFKEIKTTNDWFYISNYMCEIAEASPSVFLHKMEEEIKKTDSAIFEIFKYNDTDITSRNYYTHILWAIESLLNLKEFAPRAIYLLAALNDKEISYAITNSPKKTLFEALGVWNNDIALSAEDKVNLLNKIVFEYKSGWELLQSLLPKSNGSIWFGITSLKHRKYTHSIASTSSEETTNIFIKYYMIAIKYAKEDLERFIPLFEDCMFFSFNLKNEVFNAVKEALTKEKLDEKRFHLKRLIRSEIYHHRYFRSSHWSFSEQAIKELEELHNSINITDEVYEYLYYFDKHDIQVLDPVPYDEKTIDLKENDKKDHVLRKKAVLEIRSKGLDIQELIIKLDDNNYVSPVIGEIIAECDDCDELEYSFVEFLLGNNKNNTLIKYILKKYIINNDPSVIFDFLNHRISTNVVPDVKATLLANLVLNNSLISYIDTIADEEFKKSFWGRQWLYIDDNSTKKDLYSTLDHLLIYKNYTYALQLVYNKSQFDAYDCLLVLELIMKNAESTTFDYYLVGRVFDKIYEAYYPAKQYNNRIVPLEIYFSSALDYEKVKYYQYGLRFDPKYILEVLQIAYKKSDEKSDVKKDMSDDEKNIFKVAFNIMFHIKFCPCVEDDGSSINSDTLKEWVDLYFSLAEEQKQLEISHSILGKLFANAPIGTDGIFPHEAVRNMIEKNFSERLSNGFEVEIMNKRGVYSASAGRAELKLSEEYARYADSMKILCPQTAQILYSISNHYLKESAGERRRAEDAIQ